ncbi:MAG: A/G-specific adenine glycosylase [Candidatus Eremiobacteraeota bacterium]|nr:A/G-specific adenine glycosylase [Candidatus Eremiobacteraeota bacterium]
MSPIQRRLLRWYRVHGRSALPWRTLRDPYRTVISEFMLAQTQVERVVPKFEAFVKRFSGFAALGRASRADVLRQWRGLGYNSRAVRLHALAGIVVDRFGGALPTERGELQSLPGIGEYTAAAIRAFGFNLDDAPLDTNVRRVVQRLFFGLEYPRGAPPADVASRARELVPRGRGHDWSSAVMDLGAMICTARAPKCMLCPLRVDCAAAPVDAARLEALRAAARRASPQPSLPFERTTRYARGRIVDRLRELPPGARISLLDLHRSIDVAPGRSIEEVREFVAALERDGLVTHDGSNVGLRE